MAKQFEYSQQVKYLKMSIDDIIEMLKTKPVEWALILHDKDDTEPHIHVMVRILSNSKMTAQMVCKWFRDEPQYINIKQSRWENKLAYLCHRTEGDKDKYQYSPDEVIASFDYVQKLQEITEEVKEKLSYSAILQMIDTGVIREFNLHEYVTIEMYSKMKRQLENALEYYRRKVMNDKDRNIDVYLISGATGVGKTTMAKHFCKEKGKSFCVSSSSNDPLQDYKGQEVLIMDDMRDDAFKFHDFLKFLDNHTKSTTQSRYSNKAFIGDTIIITSSKSIDDWYDGVNEDRKQLYRRIRYVIDMDKKTVAFNEYNDSLGDYVEIYRTPNIYSMTQKEGKKNFIEGIKAFGFDVSDDILNKYMNYKSEDDDKTIYDIVKDLPVDGRQ